MSNKRANTFTKAIENIAKKELSKKLVAGNKSTSGSYTLGKYVYKSKLRSHGEYNINDLDDDKQASLHVDIAIATAKAKDIYDNRLRAYRAKAKRVLESPKAQALIEKHSELPMERIITLAVVSGKIKTTYEDLTFLDMLVSLLYEKEFDFNELYPY